MKKYYLPITVSTVVAFLFTIVFAYGSTTIDTNINTGGTLTVSGVSTLNGDVSLGNAATDVNLFTGTLQASTTALFTSGATMYNTLVLYKAASAGTATEGGVYYDSTSKVIKMYDGSNWFTVGTSTSGLSLSGSRLQLADLNYYMTYGTTSQSSLSMMTLEATSTVAIPLTIRGYNAQTANLLQIQNVAGTGLFTIDSLGRVTSNFDVGGYATVTAASGNIATKGNLAVTGAGTVGSTLGVTGATSLSTASSTGLVKVESFNVGVGTNISRVLHGVCNLTSYAAISATSTAWHDCAVTGVTTADRVFIQIPQTGASYGGLVVATSRASSTAGYIGADIFNLTGAATSSYTLATTSAEYWIFK